MSFSHHLHSHSSRNRNNKRTKKEIWLSESTSANSFPKKICVDCVHTTHPQFVMLKWNTGREQRKLNIFQFIRTNNRTHILCEYYACCLHYLHFQTLVFRLRKRHESCGKRGVVIWLLISITTRKYIFPYSNFTPRWKKKFSFAFSVFHFPYFLFNDTFSMWLVQ